MNNVSKKEDYSGYVEYMNDFYRQYDNDVGFKILKNNIKKQDLISKLNKMNNMVNFGFAVDKIYKKLNEIQSSQPFLSDNEFTLLNADYNINWLRSHAEFLYKFNSIFFLPDDVNSSGNIKLKEICDRLNYTDDQFIKLKKYFFMDIRNALSHANYRYELDEDMKFKYLSLIFIFNIIKILCENVNYYYNMHHGTKCQFTFIICTISINTRLDQKCCNMVGSGSNCR